MILGSKNIRYSVYADNRRGSSGRGRQVLQVLLLRLNTCFYLSIAPLNYKINIDRVVRNQS